MKPSIVTSILLITIVLSACAAGLAIPPTPTVDIISTLVTLDSQNDPVRPVISTSMGDFVVVSSRFVDEAHGDKPKDGEKFLMLILSQPGKDKLDPASFSLEEFDKVVHDTSAGEIYILASDGSKTISTMGGWLDDEFAMGFRVPAASGSFTLYWWDNDPIKLNP